MRSPSARQAKAQDAEINGISFLDDAMNEAHLHVSFPLGYIFGAGELMRVSD
jgi:hypothetical protein